ncbi:MAG: hypothetical protein HY778_00140 [Betaproteobacteria bacterium]|nr:hypothetical protein [Betaproteobacteria bacterium]
MPKSDTDHVLTGVVLSKEAQSAQPIREDAEQHAEHVARRQRGLSLARLFPTQLDRAMREHEMEQFRTTCDYRRRTLSMLLEARLQAVEEFLNEALVKGKGTLRRERQEFITAERIRLQRALDRHMEDFLALLDKRLVGIGRIAHPHLKALEETRLERDAERFVQWMDSRVAEFEAIVSEGVQR